MEVTFTFLIGIGLFPLLSSSFLGAGEGAGQQQRQQGLKWQLAMPTFSLSVWVTDSGLGPCFPSFSWEYFVQRLGQA